MFGKVKSKLILILIAATFFAYLSSLSNPFIWDDEQFITSNQYVQNFDIGKIFTTNTVAGAGVVSNYYRPLTTLTFAINHLLFGNNVFFYHLTNLSFHIGAGILLFLLLEEIFNNCHSEASAEEFRSFSNAQDDKKDKTTKGSLAAFFISLFFLVHPIQTEAVVYMNSLGDSMYTFFLFGSLLAFAKSIHLNSKSEYRNKKQYQNTNDTNSKHSEQLSFTYFNLFRISDFGIRIWWYFLIVFLYLLSLLSKETAIAAFPLFFVLIFLHMLRHHETSGEESHSLNSFFNLKKKILRFAQDDSIKQALLITFGIAFCVLAYIVLRLTLLNFGNTLNYYSSATYYSTHLLVRIFTFARVLWVYLGLILWPYPLHMERSIGLVYSVFSWEVWGMLGLVFGILYLVFWEIRKKHTGIILFGFALSSCLLIPVSGIIPINGILYEHWLYVPMVGFFVMVYGIWKVVSMSFWGVKRLQNQIRKDPGQARMTVLNKTLISFATLLSILYIFLTIRQNNIWGDPVRFYSYTLSFAPNSARLHNNLGMSLADIGDTKGSIVEYKKALSLGQGYPEIYNNLGNAQMQVGDYKEAEKNLEKALELSPSFSVAKQNLLKLYLLSKQYVKARELSGNNPQVEQIIQQLQGMN